MIRRYMHCSTSALYRELVGQNPMVHITMMTIQPILTPRTAHKTSVMTVSRTGDLDPGPDLDLGPETRPLP